MDPVTEEWARWWVGTQNDFTPLLAPLGLTVYDSHCLGIPGAIGAQTVPLPSPDAPE